MALLWCDGFDHYDTSTDGINAMLDGVYAEVKASTSGGPQSDNPRTGSRSLKFNTSGNFIRRVFGGTKTTVGVGYAFYASQLPIVNSRRILAQFRTDANKAQCSIMLTTTGRVELRRGDADDTVIEQSDPVITAGAYQHFECRVTIDDTAGACEVRVNGTTVLDVSNVDTQAETDDGADQVVIGEVTAGAQDTPIWIDDLFAWDTEGDVNNDFLGDHRVYLIMPDQDTAQADWTSTEDTGYEAIDEEDPDDDTSYIEADAAEEASEFDLEALPSEVSTISAVVAVARMRKTDAGSCNVQMSMVSGSSQGNGEDRSITEVYTYWQDIFEEDPDTGAPWTASGLNSAKIRFERTA